MENSNNDSPWFLIIAVVLAGSVIFVFVYEPFISGQERWSVVSRMKADQRSLATFLEAYYVDHNAYPPSIEDDACYGGYLTRPFVDMFKFRRYDNIVALLWGEYGIFVILGFLGMIMLSFILLARKPDYWNFGKIQSKILVPGMILICLVIAILYKTNGDFIGNNRVLPEWRGKSLGMRYYADKNGWIVISLGPDGDYDIDPEKYYNSEVAQPSFELLCLAGTYDPTNGTFSNGDVYRVKQ
jgi:hypothetical protein